ncbi:hypothetical protein TUM22923_13910 [Polynucleobacter sp. TUM22923]|jgi:hypothetical protein|nr:hypothetical protein TUM22923_13910 [Polynucleobacter sp. TUM22923]
MNKGYFANLITLLSSSSTLICCALPALLVSIGAGATLSAAVTIFPKIVWVSENKELIFGFAGAMLFISGVLQYRARNMACPIDQREACSATRTSSKWIYLFSLGLYLIGGFFAFIAPIIFN